MVWYMWCNLKEAILNIIMKKGDVISARNLENQIVIGLGLEEWRIKGCDYKEWRCVRFILGSRVGIRVRIMEIKGCMVQALEARK